MPIMAELNQPTRSLPNVRARKCHAANWLLAFRRSLDPKLPVGYVRFKDANVQPPTQLMTPRESGRSPDGTNHKE